MKESGLDTKSSVGYGNVQETCSHLLSLNVPQGQEMPICRSVLTPHRMHPSLTDVCMYQDCQCLGHRIILADTYSDMNRPDLLFIFVHILL